MNDEPAHAEQSTAPAESTRLYAELLSTGKATAPLTERTLLAWRNRLRRHLRRALAEVQKGGALKNSDLTPDYFRGMAEGFRVEDGMSRYVAEATQRVRKLCLELADALEAQPGQRGPRPSTRKIQVPWDPETLYPAPNLQGNGTRNLGRAASGDVKWRQVQDGSGGMLALVGDQAIARVDLTPGREGEALRDILTRVVSPRALKTMVGISRLVWEKTNRKPLNQVTTVTPGELARAAGYEPGEDRHIKA